MPIHQLTSDKRIAYPLKNSLTGHNSRYQLTNSGIIQKISIDCRFDDLSLTAIRSRATHITGSLTTKGSLRDAPSFINFPNHGTGGQTDALKKHLIEMMSTSNINERSNRHSTRVDWKDKHCDSHLRFQRIRVSTRQKHSKVGIRSVRRPDLLSINHEFITITNCSTTQGCQIGTSVGLGEELAPKFIGTNQSGYKTDFLLLRSCRQQS